jgi:hypothetical protein
MEGEPGAWKLERIRRGPRAAAGCALLGQRPSACRLPARLRVSETVEQQRQAVDLVSGSVCPTVRIDVQRAVPTERRR